MGDQIKEKSWIPIQHQIVFLYICWPIVPHIFGLAFKFKFLKSVIYLVHFPTPRIDHLVDPSSVFHGQLSELFVQQLNLLLLVPPFDCKIKIKLIVNDKMGAYTKNNVNVLSTGIKIPLISQTIIELENIIKPNQPYKQGNHIIAH